MGVGTQPAYIPIAPAEAAYTLLTSSLFQMTQLSLCVQPIPNKGKSTSFLPNTSSAVFRWVSNLSAVLLEALSKPDTNVECSFPIPHSLHSFHLCSKGVLQRTPPKFDPPLPPRRVQSLHRLGMGLLNKVILSYDEPWWDPDCSWFFLLPSSFPDRNADRATKKIGAASTNEESKNREREHLLRNDALLLQNYVPVTGRAALVAYVGPPRAQTVEALPSERVAKIFHERAAAALHHNTSKDGGPPSMKPAEPTHTVVTRWAADPHSCGSYTYLPNRSEGREGAGPMDILECGRPLWGERLGFCGEHTSSDQ